MVKLTHFSIFFVIALGVGLSACRELPVPSDTPEAQQRYDLYREKIASFEKTRNIDEICAAGNIAGNLEAPFPMKESDRADTFVRLILTGLREAEGSLAARTACADSLWEALYIGRPTRLKISRPMAECLDDARLDGLFSADDYLACANRLNYSPY